MFMCLGSFATEGSAMESFKEMLVSLVRNVDRCLVIYTAKVSSSLLTATKDRK